MISTNSIEQAYEIYSSTFSNNKIQSLVFRTHGGQTTDKLYNPMNVMTSVFEMSEENPAKRDAYISKYGLAEARRGVRTTVNEYEFKASLLLINFLDTLCENGTLILSSCTVGRDKMMIQELSYICPSGVTIFANRDWSSSSFSTNGKGGVTSAEITTDESENKLGWIMWGVRNEEKVKSSGAKPKFGYMILLDTQKSGLLNFKF
ncbi:hypothetical protein D3C86_1116460 [compost metagenome]